MINYKRSQIPSLLFLFWFLFPVLTLAQNPQGKIKTVHSTSELIQEASKIQPGTTLLLENGNYSNIKLIVNNSGTSDLPIIIMAKTPGKVFFTGNVKVELRGEYITLSGIYFKNGNRNIEEWKTHGPGLVALYGSHNRITQCAFHCFDQANSAYITTSLAPDGKAPQYCRIDHCSFTEKITFDQVINLNNKPKKTTVGEPGIPMYHRIDHCFFSNPRKPGNAGGGIRIGYWRRDLGRCLVDSNLFMRQDSEPEIITSKSRENVYYANTFLNCQGTMNFRHGDKQVAINNFYRGNDTKYQYGGMFVWGSEHIIACNYFELPTTLKSRGNAALYLNPGAIGKEHALAFNILLANNIFANNNGYAIHFDPLYERRVEWCKKNKYILGVPRDIQIKGNVFFSNKSYNYPFFKDNHPKGRNISWENNLLWGQNPGIKNTKGLKNKPFSMKRDTHKILKYTKKQHKSSTDTAYNIKGIDLNILKLVNGGIKGNPITWDNVGPNWLKEIPGTYAKTGKLTPQVKVRFTTVKKRRKKNL